MNSYPLISAILFIVLYIANFSECVNKNEEALKALNISTNIDFDQIEVSFGSSTIVQFGNTLNLGDVKVQPNVQIKNFKDGLFHTLAMVDPDAPSRTNPIARVSCYMFNTYYFQV